MSNISPWDLVGTSNKNNMGPVRGNSIRGLENDRGRVPVQGRRAVRARDIEKKEQEMFRAASRSNSTVNHI